MHHVPNQHFNQKTASTAWQEKPMSLQKSRPALQYERRLVGGLMDE